MMELTEEELTQNSREDEEEHTDEEELENFFVTLGDLADQIEFRR